MQDPTFPQKPNKDQIFQRYVAWKALPVGLRSSRGLKLSNKLGLEDETTLELLGIKNQAQFAQKYDVTVFTLSQWNKLIKDKDLLAETRVFTQQLAKNVLFAMYKNAISENPNAHKDRANFLKFLGGFDNKPLANRPPDNLADYLKQNLKRRTLASHSN